jgi:hypothetical protein
MATYDIKFARPLYCEGCTVAKYKLAQTVMYGPEGVVEKELPRLECEYDEVCRMWAHYRGEEWVKKVRSQPGLLSVRGVSMYGIPGFGDDATQPLAPVDIRSDLATFAVAMEEKLRRHDYRPGCENETFEYLFWRLKEEHDELKYCATVKELKDELVDIANFCMRIYCKLLRKEDTLPGDISGMNWGA